jgi:hypothetical protein
VHVPEEKPEDVLPGKREAMWLNFYGCTPFSEKIVSEMKETVQGIILRDDIPSVKAKVGRLQV